MNDEVHIIELSNDLLQDVNWGVEMTNVIGVNNNQSTDVLLPPMNPRSDGLPILELIQKME